MRHVLACLQLRPSQTCASLGLGLEHPSSYTSLLNHHSFLITSHRSLPGSQIWRLCFFIAGLPIIWWIGRGSMNIAVWGVERTMFTWQNAVS